MRARLAGLLTIAAAAGCRGAPSAGTAAASATATATTPPAPSAASAASTTPVGDAAAAAPEVWIGRRVADGADAGATIAATASHGRTVRAVLERRVAVRATTMYSTANDNGSFGFRVELDELVPTGEGIVGRGGAWWISDGLGASEGRSDTTFWLDRESAVALASAFAVPLHERKRLDEGVHAAWVVPTSASARDRAPVTVKLRIANTGHTDLVLDLGGFASGSRDVHFDFKATRDGTPVPTIDAGGFGTSGSDTRPLGPGAHADFAVDLRKWIALDVPGTYVVESTFEAQLSPVRHDHRPSTTADAADLWDLAPTTTSTITVRP